jgi:alkanesulfonate monooxygenase SsuD/methylene tetrahydromethanopterin reductase-like flavin-dependent oxidoreductase (luciferase family)
LFREGPGALTAFAASVENLGVDRIWLGDHVSFNGGRGYDGLLGAMAVAAVTRRVTVQTAVYLLPLRHPLPVARQVGSVAELARGRFIFGVGVGGDDPMEVINCGVELSTRGRRMDESLELVHRLLAGETVDHHGEMFHLDAASIAPVPDPAVPVVVGGRSHAALRRAGRLGDGWLGVWLTPERFEANAVAVAEAGFEANRGDVAWQHGFLAWCGFGRSREAARPRLAAAMEAFYDLPFDRFERSSPFGTADDVAAALAPYVAAGASSFLLAPIAADLDECLTAVSRVRSLLRMEGS